MISPEGFIDLKIKEEKLDQSIIQAYKSEIIRWMGEYYELLTK